MTALSGAYFEEKIIRVCVSWYLQYPLSYRQIEAMLLDRGLEVHHSTLNRWVTKFTPVIRRGLKDKKPLNTSKWTMEEEHVKIKGRWKYLYQALDPSGRTLDFVLMEEPNARSARSFLQKAIKTHVWCVVPSSVTGRARSRA